MKAGRYPDLHPPRRPERQANRSDAPDTTTCAASFLQELFDRRTRGDRAHRRCIRRLPRRSPWRARAGRRARGAERRSRPRGVRHFRGRDRPRPLRGEPRLRSTLRGGAHRLDARNRRNGAAASLRRLANATASPPGLATRPTVGLRQDRH